MELKLIGQMGVILFALLLILALWLRIMEKRALSNWRQYATKRGYPDAKVRGELPPVEWEEVDALDTRHLEVKHEPLKEAP